MQLHELAHPLLAHANAPGQQLFPRAWPAVAATRLGVDRFDVYQQRVITEVAPLRRAGPSNEVLAVPRHAGPQHPALH